MGEERKERKGGRVDMEGLMKIIMRVRYKTRQKLLKEKEIDAR